MLVQCANRTHPIKAVADILNNDAHVVETPKGVQYRLPFQNVKYHTTIRVVDYFPDKLEDFACLLPVSDDRDSDEESIDGCTTSQRRNGQKWGWQFGLIVEDGRQASKGAQKERLELYLFCDDAEFLLKLDAKEYVFPELTNTTSLGIRF
jgi:protection-of-telomeres protein 1